LSEEEEEGRKKNIWPSRDFLVQYFVMLFHATGYVFIMKTLKNEE